jgi:hypothetical protein
LNSGCGFFSSASALSFGHAITPPPDRLLSCLSTFRSCGNSYGQSSQTGPDLPLEVS